MRIPEWKESAFLQLYINFNVSRQFRLISVNSLECFVKCCDEVVRIFYSY